MLTCDKTKPHYANDKIFIFPFFSFWGLPYKEKKWKQKPHFQKHHSYFQSSDLYHRKKSLNITTLKKQQPQ